MLQHFWILWCNGIYVQCLGVVPKLIIYVMKYFWVTFRRHNSPIVQCLPHCLPYQLLRQWYQLWLPLCHCICPNLCHNVRHIVCYIGHNDCPNWDSSSPPRIHRCILRWQNHIKAKIARVEDKILCVVAVIAHCACCGKIWHQGRQKVVFFPYK